MAKSSRSSSKKANKSKLRSRVFRPVEERRTVRLNSALLRLASQPKPTEMGTMKMDVEHQNYEQHEAGEAHKAKQTEGQTQIVESGTKAQAAAKVERVHGLPEL
ncbi:MAG: hypothetical protein M1836_004257 [Candelina mexicana]|nr:MAG: hypothetical protein M1836_004257 [Candelina mexicana]